MMGHFKQKDIEQKSTERILEEEYGIPPGTIPPIQTLLDKLGLTLEEFREKYVSISLPPLEEEE
jgi:hypothetical protein